MKLITVPKRDFGQGLYISREGNTTIDTNGIIEVYYTEVRGFFI